MTDLPERLLRLWTQPLGDRAQAAAAFGLVYADPVMVNGMTVTVAQLVDRARSLQESFDGLSMQILDQVETPDRVVIAFVMRGRHQGTYLSPLGGVSPTGRDVQVRTIDVLAIEDGRVSAIWVVADDLGLLTQLDAVSLASQR